MTTQTLEKKPARFLSDSFKVPARFLPDYLSTSSNPSSG